MRTAILCQQGLAHTFTGSQKPVPPHGLAQWEFLLRASFPALCSSEIPSKFQQVTAGGSGSVLCHQGGSRSPSESDHPILVWGTCAWGLLRQGQLGLSGQKRIFHVSSSRAGLSKAWGRELLQGMPAGVRVPATAPRGRRPQGPFCLCWRGLVAPAGVSHHPCTGGWLWSHSQPQARPWGLCPPVQAESPAQPSQPFRAASCTGKVFERRSLSCSLCPRKSKLEFDAAPLERRRSLRK